MFKRTLFFVAAALFLVIQTQAQLSLSATGGLNLATMSHDFPATPKFDTKPSVHVGVAMSAPISDKLFFGADLLYSRKGFSSNITVDDERSDEVVDARFNYLTLTPALGYNLTSSLRASLGFQFAYLLAVNYAYTNGPFDGTVDDASNFWRQDIDYGITLGLNYGIPNFLNDKLSLGLRYEYGLNAQFKGIFFGQRNQEDIRDGYHRNLQFSVAYKLF